MLFFFFFFLSVDFTLWGKRACNQNKEEGSTGQTILLFGAHGQDTAVTKTKKKVLQDWFDTGNFTCSSQGPLGQDTAITCLENGMRTDNRISLGKTAVFL